MPTPSEPKSNPNRRLSTIVFADIVGYTALMNTDESKALEILNGFKAAVEDNVLHTSGEVIQYYGDACLLAFDSAIEAVDYSINMQMAFKENKIPVRVGIHLGEVVFKNDNVFGDGVNLASRLESVAIPGSVLISRVVEQQIRNKSKYEVKELGWFEFKNVKDPIEVIALKHEALRIPTLSEMKGKGKPLKRKRSSIVKYTSIGLFIILLFAGYFWRNSLIKEQPENHKDNIRTIAVLPFKILNQDPVELSFFGDGLTQEVIDELAGVKNIHVSAFTQSYFYKDQNTPPKEIASDLNVQYLISGSMRFIPDKNLVKVSVELFDPHKNKRIWFQNFSEKLDEIGDLQVKIASHVADALDIRLSRAELNKLQTPNTISGDALQLFLKARSEINDFTQESFNKADSLLKLAISLDTNYAQAYTLRAWVILLMSDPTIKRTGAESKMLIDEAEALIKRSLLLSPSNSDTYLVRSSIKLYARNKIQDALHDVEKALELKSWPTTPTNFCICTIVSSYLAARDYDRASWATELSKKIDPGNILLAWDEANVLMHKGELKAAEVLYEQAALAQTNEYFLTYLGWSQYHNKDYKMAVENLEKAMAMTDKPVGMTVAYLSNAYYHLGDQNRSDKFLQDLTMRVNDGEINLNQFIATIYAARGKNDKALSHLNIAHENAEFGLAVMTGIDPVFKPLFNNPVFQSIMSEMQTIDD